MEQKVVKIQNLHISYLETKSDGSAPPLLILPGWASTAERWKTILAILEEEGTKAIALDFPGRGGSSTAQEPWDLDRYVAFVLDFINALQIKTYYLLGHSFGGRVAIKIGVLHDSAPEKLILVDAAGVTPRDKKRIAVYKVSTKIGGLIFSLPLLSIFRSIARKIIYYFAGGYDFYVLKGPMKETFKRIVGEDLTPYLGKIFVPTYIIWGEKDRMTPLADAHIMHKKIRNSKLIILNGGGHSLNLEMPEKLAAEIYSIVKYQ